MTTSTTDRAGSASSHSHSKPLASSQNFPIRILTFSSGIDSIARSDLRNLWQKLFLNILNKLGGYDPLYWIIDAVDECEPSQAFLALITRLFEGASVPSAHHLHLAFIDSVETY